MRADGRTSRGSSVAAPVPQALFENDGRRWQAREQGGDVARHRAAGMSGAMFVDCDDGGEACQLWWVVGDAWVLGPWCVLVLG